MRKFIYILFFLTLQTTAQPLVSKEINSFEVNLKSDIDSTFLVIDAEKAIKKHMGKDILIDEKEKELLQQLITDLFVTKKYSIFKCRQKIQGFSYSSDQILTINVKFNENEKDMYYIDLCLPNYKVEYSDKFKDFLKVFYSIR